MPAKTFDHFFKANWAGQMLVDLDHAVAEWFKDNTHFSHRIEPDADNPGQNLLKVRADEIPVEPVSLIIGDIVQNLRSSLDHLAFALACTHTQPLSEEVARASQFPIIGDEDSKGVPGSGPALFRKSSRRIQCIDPQAQAFIERLQPYHLGAKYRTHPLWRLMVLSNIDKHRTLHTGAAYGAAYHVYRCSIGGVFSNEACIVKDETVVARLGTIVPLDPDKTAEMQVRPIMTIAFTEGEFRNLPILDTLCEILNYVGSDVLTPMTAQFL